MSLEFQIVPYVFNGSLETKVDEKSIGLDKMTVIENGVFNVGETIRKRNGYTSLGLGIVGSSSTILNAAAMARFQDELMLFANSHFYTFAQARQRWVDRGAYVSCACSNIPVIRNSSTQTTPDLAYLDNLAVYAWADTRGGIRASVRDLVSGSIVINDYSISSTGVNPKVVACGTNIFVFYVESTTLKGRRLDQTSALAFTVFESAFTVYANVAASNKVHDWGTINNAMVWAVHNDASGVQIGYLTQDKIVGSILYGYSAPVAVAEDVTSCLALYVNLFANLIYVAVFNSTNGTRIFSLNLNLSVNLSATTVDSTTSPITSNVTVHEDIFGNIIVVYDVYNATDSKHFLRINTLALPSTMGSASVLKRGLGLISKLFVQNNLLYLVAVHSSSLQSTYFILDTSGNLVAKPLALNAGGLPATADLTSVVTKVAGVYVFAGLQKTQLPASTDSVFTSTGITEFTVDFRSLVNYSSVQLNDNLHIGGGFLSMYDGLAIVEHGFHLFPEGVSVAAVLSGGSIADGTKYAHVAIFEWVDGQGQVHYSSPSVPTSTDMSGGSGSGSFTVTVPTLRITAKTTVRIGIYRTEAAGQVFYKLGTVANDTTVDTVTFTDTFISSGILGNQLSYTNPLASTLQIATVAQNNAAPATNLLAHYFQRVLLVDATNPDVIWFSKEALPGVPIEFSSDFYISMPVEGGVITALQTLDSNLIVFKESRIYLITGEGPTSTGEQNDFTTPQLLASDVGCVDSDSVVLTPDGLMFKTMKGIYLLSRVGQVVYIGAPVEKYNSLTIRSADMVASNNQIRFLTDTGPCLVYDYFFKKWSTFINHSGYDALIWNDVYCYLRTDGKVYQENAGSYVDDQVPIILRMVTGWIKIVAGGYQRVTHLLVNANWYSSHTLQSKVYYDYQPTPDDQYDFNFETAQLAGPSTWGGDATWGAGTTWGGGTGVYQFREHLSHQKCEALKLEFLDSMNAIYGSSYTIVNVALRIGKKEGLSKHSIGVQNTVGAN